MLATKDCTAFVEALAYWSSGNRSDARGSLVKPENVVETRTPLAQLRKDLGEPVNVDTPAGWLLSWPNVRLGGRQGVLFVMDFGESRAVHFASLPAECQWRGPTSPATRPSPSPPSPPRTAGD